MLLNMILFLKILLRVSKSLISYNNIKVSSSSEDIEKLIYL